jgi:maltose O-acetyltransferase
MRNSHHNKHFYADSMLRVVLRHKNVIKKLFWFFIYYLIAKHLPDTPLPLSGLSMWIREMCARNIFEHCGNNIKIHSHVDFGTGLGVSLGNYSSLNRNCWVANDTVIGDYVMMGPGVAIISSSHNFSDIDVPMVLQGAPERRKVLIHDDVWIGTGAIILPGVIIGSHSIIGAGSVVTRDIPEWSIAAGNPAVVIRSRSGSAA